MPLSRAVTLQAREAQLALRIVDFFREDGGDLTELEQIRVLNAVASQLIGARVRRLQLRASSPHAQKDGAAS